MDKLLQARVKFALMPFGLRIITLVFFAFILFLPIALMPFGTFTINDDVVSFSEFWKRGGGLVFCVIGITCPIMALGIYQRKKWAQMAPIIFVTCLVSLEFIASTSSQPTLEESFNVLLLPLLTAWYFLYKKSVKQYFTN